MEDEAIERAKLYAARRNQSVVGWLGSGIHGIVCVLEGNAHSARVALKMHFSGKPYDREKEVYERLQQEGVDILNGFRVPQRIASDDELMALEITIVKPPFVLDFAGAWLDFPPKFSDEVWADWTRKNEEQFGDDWPTAQLVLAELEDLGIYMHDPTPGNIRFR